MRGFWFWVALATGAPGVAHAAGDDASADTSAFELSGTVEVVSDYRFRGISLSAKDPALQGSLEIEHKSGIYAGTWASTIKGSPADVEVDLYGGWRGNAGDVGLDVGAVAYVYPGGSGLDYVEFLASASYSLGPAEMTVGLGYAPDQANIGSDDNLYLYGDASMGVPNTPITVTAHVGREDGSLAGPTGKKWDWSLGAEAVVDKFTLGLHYVDTDINRLVDPGRTANAGLVASLKFEF